MGLFGYELRKLWFQKTSCILILAVWIIGQFSFSRSSVILTEQIALAYQEENTQIEAAISGKSVEAALEWLNEAQIEASTLEEVMTDYRWIRAVNTYLEQYKYLSDYPTYLETILSQADTMEKVAVFQNQGAFAISNIRKTKTDFARLQEQMQGVEVSSEAAEFVSAGTGYSAATLLLVIQIVILAVCIFGYDQEGDRKLVMTMQYRGRKEATFAKTCLLIVGTIFLIFAMYAGLLIQAYMLFGPGSLLAPIQSIPEFKRCSQMLNCLEYLVLFFFNKILAFIFLALLASAAVSWAKSIGGICLFGAAAGVWFLMYQRFPEWGIFLWLKEVNPVAWVDTWEWMRGYKNVSLFTNAVGFIPCFYIGVSIGIVLSASLTVWLFPRKFYHRVPRLLQRTLRAVTGAFARTCHTTSLIWQLLYQMTGYKKRFLLVLVVIFAVYTAGAQSGRSYYGLERATYNSYMTTIQGLYTAETEAFLTAEEARLNESDGYLQGMSERLNTGKISQEEYDAASWQLRQEQAQKNDGFELVKGQWNLVRTADEAALIQGRTESHAGFFHMYLAEELFNDKEKETELLGLFLILVFVILVPYERIDFYSEKLFQTTFRGRMRRMLVRSVLAMVIAVVLGGAVYAAYWLTVYSGYQKQDFSVAAVCLELFEGWRPEITMGDVMLLSAGAKCVGMLLTSLLISTIALLPLEMTAYYLLAMVFAGGPFLLYQAGIPVQWFTLLGLFQAERLAGGSMTGYWIYMIVCIFVVTGTYTAVFCRRVYIGRGKRG